MKIAHNTPKSVLIFVPSSFVYLTESKIVYFKGKKLKTAYMLDIIHSCMTKKYFTGETEISLYSRILKENYGNLYPYYIEYLVEKKFLKIKKNYSTGLHSKIYTVHKRIFDEKTVRYENYDKFLMKKKEKQKTSYMFSQVTDTYNIPSDIKKKLVDSLYHVQLDFKSAKFYLDNELNDSRITKDAYMKNLYSIECINKSEIFYKEDKYGRFHTNFTVLKSNIRNEYLKIDGKDTSELDINNSQPMFLAIFLKEQGFDKVYKEEFDRFVYNVMNCKFYIEFMNKLAITKKEAKEYVFKALFWKNHIDTPANKIFKELYPQIFNWMSDYKLKNGDHAMLAYELQKKESSLIFGDICTSIFKKIPDIKLFTVHDSVYFPKEYTDDVQEIFYKYVNESVLF